MHDVGMNTSKHYTLYIGFQLEFSCVGTFVRDKLIRTDVYQFIYILRKYKRTYACSESHILFILNIRVYIHIYMKWVLIINIEFVARARERKIFTNSKI